MPKKQYNQINKGNIYEILKVFAKEYKKSNGKQPIEIIIVGGGSILINYGFRDMTQDLDIAIPRTTDLHDAISHVADAYNLNPDWMNTDFKNTASYSSNLSLYSKHFCSFNGGIVEFRTINDEYLIAMKMVALRRYRSDFSDIIGILAENKENETPISYQQIETAFQNLYGIKALNNLDTEIVKTIKNLCNSSADKLRKYYTEEKLNESSIYKNLTDIDAKYEGLVTEANIEKIIDDIRLKNSISKNGTTCEENDELER